MELETAGRAQMQRKHVFVVNRSPAFLDVLRELFQDERYNVTTTNFVPTTFAQIAALQPSILIIDLEMGQRAGWDLLERLKVEAITHGIPVIVVSTSQALLDRAKADEARYGGQRFLVKPLHLDAIVAAVAELIGPA